jgi:hypothetical protein
MAFLAYVAILLVSISGILLELNWLTQPKLEAKLACARNDRAAYRRGPARRRHSGSAECRTRPGLSETSRRAASD